MPSINGIDVLDCLVTGSVEEDTVNSDNAAKTRKISYTPVKCYLCNTIDNPKRMTSLAGSSKIRFKEVAYFFKQMDEHQGSDTIDINTSKLCKDCTEIVLKELNGCFICGEIVSDPRMKTSINDGRYKALAMEERLCFQGVNSKREPTENDQSCFCCQKRIMAIIQEEASGNTMKMKVVLQRSKKTCIVCLDTNNLQDFSRFGRINMFIQTGMCFTRFIVRKSKI